MAPVVWNAFLAQCLWSSSPDDRPERRRVPVRLAALQGAASASASTGWPCSCRWCLSTIIVGFLWKLFLNPNFGIVNQALYSLGPRCSGPALARRFLDGARRAHPRQCLALRRLSDARLSRRHAAHSRVRSSRRRGSTAPASGSSCRSIVWPLVAPATTILFTLLFIGAFNWFEMPYVMVGLDGSPFGSTDVLGLVFLPHGLRQPERQHPGFRHGLGARHAAVPLHRSSSRPC